MRWSHQLKCSSSSRHWAWRALYHQTGQAREFVTGIFKHLAQDFTQNLGALGHHHAKLGQQPADAIDARGALLLEAFA